MIREAINRELARRETQGQHPANPYQLAKALDLYSQSVYRMLGDNRPGFNTAHADRMMAKLGLRIVRKGPSETQ